MRKINIPSAAQAWQSQKRILKFLAITAFSIVSFLFVVIFIALLVFPPSKYKNEIRSNLKNITAATDVSIGSIHTNLFFSNAAVGFVMSDLSIMKGKGIEKIEIPRTEIRLNPIKLFMAKIPIDVVMMNPSISLGSLGEAEEEKQTEEPSKAPGQSKIAKLLPYMSLYFSTENATFNLDHIFSTDHKKEPSQVRVEKSKIQASLNGSDGHFKVKVESELNIDLDKGKMTIYGPASLDCEGKLKLKEARPTDLSIEEFNINLDETNLGALGWIEKISNHPLVVRLKGNVHFPQQNGKYSFELKDSAIEYDNFVLNFDISRTENRSLFLKWMTSKTELKALKMPISVFRDVNFSGSIESSGEFKSHPSGDRVGQWRVSFNNVSVPAQSIGFFDPKSSSGDVKVSFISQGNYNNGFVVSQGTEMQISATPAQLVEKQTRLMKAAGEKFEFLLKIAVENDEFQIKKMMLFLHTLEMEGKGRVENFSKFLSGDPSPTLFRLNTNRVDLSNWGSFFPAFRRQPTLEGFFEFKGQIETQLSLGKNEWKNVGWTVDQLTFSNIQGKIERSAWTPSDFEESLTILGPFKANVLMKGRGKGDRIDRSEVLADVNLDRSRVLYKNSFEKKETTPLSLNIFVDQSSDRFQFKQGRLRFHDLDMNFQGQLTQGKNSNAIGLVMNKPIDLANWNEFLRTKSNIPLNGQIQWNGKLFFPADKTLSEMRFDWRKLRLEGKLDVKNVQAAFGKSENSVSNFNAQVLLSPQAITIPKASLNWGSSKVAFSGSLEALNSKKSHTLWQWVNNKAWNMESQIQIDQLSSTATSEKPKTAELSEKTIKEYFQSEHLKQSQVRVALNIGMGEYSRIPFSSLKTILQWKDGLLRLAPVSASTLDGSLNGSFVYSLKDFYNRGADPELSASLKTKSLSIEKLLHYQKPSFEKILQGQLDGDMTLSSKGFVSKDLLNNAKGRVTGQIRKGYFDSLSVLQSSLEEASRDEKLSKFLAQKAGKTQCIDKAFEAEIDAQIKNGGLVVDTSNVKFASKTELLLGGELSSDLMIDMKGEIFPSSQCLNPQSLRCLGSSQSRLAIPFVLKGQSGNAEATLAYTEIGRRIASCELEKVGNKVKTEIKEQQEKIEEKAKDQVKKLFKGL